ncbi:hypothetical protein [Streptomyces ambofaciens]|uniref:hypothetical protein n=1 Tax=Streptomyces ambofaciens TaxID=1889 RepID=UPI0011DFC982|nr:hypothetical protein [Streptomyces ambofaciens]
MLVTALAAATLSAPAASAGQSAGCNWFAKVPTVSSTGRIVGVGGRTGCTNKINLSVEVRRVIDNWPDQTVASGTSWSFVTGSVTVYGDRQAGCHDYFTETIWEGTSTKIQSAVMRSCR